jgi:ABC-type polysaccharide/polyol phosphate export permease
MILLFLIFLAITALIVVLTGVFAYIAGKLYIVFRDIKQEDIQPLLGVIYPKDKND